MKKILIQNKYTLLLLLFWGMLLPIAFTSCKYEMRGSCDIATDLDGGYNLLEVPITILTHQSSLKAANTRAAVGQEDGDYDEKSYGDDSLNENKIDKLDLFILLDGQVKGHYSTAQKTLEHQEATTDPKTPASVTAKVPKTVADELEKAVKEDNTKKVQLYLVVNAKQTDFSAVKTYEELKAIVQDDTNMLNPTPLKPQEHFLMDGMLECQPLWGTETKYIVKDNTIKLRRAASKIRVRIDMPDSENFKVINYQNGTPITYKLVEGPFVKLVHYTEAGTLIKSDTLHQPTTWKDSEYRTMTKRSFTLKEGETDPAVASKYNGEFYAAFPFYTYENDWSTIDNQYNETYVIVKLKLRPVTESGDPYYIDKEGKLTPDPTDAEEDKGRDYFYRLPINYRMEMDGVPKERLLKLERNYLYDIYTSIQVLGSIDEEVPVKVKSNVAIQPWVAKDEIDGAITQAHFLVVDELTPTMPNINTRKVDYISSTPVTTTFTKAYYQYYDLRGNYRKVVYDDKGYKRVYDKDGKQVGTDTHTGVAWDGAAVSASPEYLENGVLTIEHAVPNNYVPFYIEFTVKQNSPGTLEDKVVVTQYPPRFVTGNESPGLWNGSEKSEGQSVYADFRHQTPLGTLVPFSAIGSTKLEAQGNEIFSRVSTVVPQRGEIIGVAVDASGKTKSDEQSNKMISPEFIISSQYGMSQGTEQRTNNARIPADGFSLPQSFAQGYGPHSGRSKFKRETPYQNNYTLSGYSGYYWLYGDDSKYYPVNNFYDTYQDGANVQLLWRTYTSAEDRCYKYFEGEYGADGDYVENYIDANGFWKRRTIHKTFKYKGHWRIPTLAEVDMINRLQQDPNSTVKGLMFGSYCWTAEEGKAYEFKNNRWVYSSNAGTASWGGYNLPKIFVRCVFDTFGLDDKGEYEEKRP